MHKSLLDVVANAELLDELTVLVDVVLLDVGEETTTLTNQHEQTTAGVEVLLVGLHVLGQLLDALGQDGNLNLGVAGVLGVLAELGGELRLALLGNRHDFTFLVAAAGCAPHGLDSPSTGKPPVERISKWRVPTERYVTTDQQHNAAIAQLDHVMQETGTTKEDGPRQLRKQRLTYLETISYLWRKCDRRLSPWRT